MTMATTTTSCTHSRTHARPQANSSECNTTKKNFIFPIILMLTNIAIYHYFEHHRDIIIFPKCELVPYFK